VSPTLSQAIADAARFQTDLDLDQDDATPKTPLFRDLVIFTTDENASMAALGGTGKSVSVEGISAKVLRDCGALGVRF
jgi:hypothetical protein